MNIRLLILFLLFSNFSVSANTHIETSLVDTLSPVLTWKTCGACALLYLGIQFVKSRRKKSNSKRAISAKKTRTQNKNRSSKSKKLNNNMQWVAGAALALACVNTVSMSSGGMCQREVIHVPLEVNVDELRWKPTRTFDGLTKDDLPDEIKKIKQTGKLPRSMLVYGPPGTGKSHSISGLSYMFALDRSIRIPGGHFHIDVRTGGILVKKVFELARTIRDEKGVPVIIILEEADAALLAREKHNMEESGRGLNGVVTGFKRELDEDNHEKNKDIVLIAISNTIENMDDAATRSGRMDDKIRFKLPNKKERKNILQLHAEEPRIIFDYEYAANKTKKFSGADLKWLVTKLREKGPRNHGAIDTICEKWKKVQEERKTKTDKENKRSWTRILGEGLTGGVRLGTTGDPSGLFSPVVKTAGRVRDWWSGCSED